MDVQALATTPLFLSSLVICALVAAYAIATAFLGVFRGISRVAASAGLHPGELEAVEHSGIFHNQLEDLIEKIITLEELSVEVPEPFDDHSWSRLLELCDNLENVRGELHSLLRLRDFESGNELAKLLCGASSVIPNIPRPSGGLELRLVSVWHSQANELLQRMISRIEDAIRYGAVQGKPAPSQHVIQVLEELRFSVLDQGTNNE